MKKINVAGMTSLIGGVCLYAYRELGNFMGKSGNLNTYNIQKSGNDHTTLFDMLHEENFDWIDSIPWEPIQDGANYVVNMPLWLLMVIVGSFLLIIGGIFIKK
ncbi:MAG: hypothetical protein HF978_16015 [Desulfobacteraceae bacterium]|nr:hypothetical protein [Desulfobacteraceae bacterium]MBC2757049.1 hypothetical protein [Desulfobacteraceae bacterium]